MILNSSILARIDHYKTRKDLILKGMRLNIERAAAKRDLILGDETVEFVYLLQDEHGTWRSSRVGVASHVKITIEREAEHA